MEQTDTQTGAADNHSGANQGILHELQPGQSRAEAFREFVSTREFPCVGAKAAKSRGDMIILEPDASITTPLCDIEIRDGLRSYIDRLEPGGWALQTFVVIFSGPENLSEQEFETALWNRLQCLHNLDVVTGQKWNDDTSSDPDADHFSMSLLGEPFFVIGLHPNSSRPARRFHYPAMVFNSHAQFEKLREDGRFERMQRIIRKRDKELSGSVNPMLANFGAGSEAPQYSGRKVDEGWTCPFSKKDVQ